MEADFEVAAAMGDQESMSWLLNKETQQTEANRINRLILDITCCIPENMDNWYLHQTLRSTLRDSQPSSNLISPMFYNKEGAGFKTNCDLGTLFMASRRFRQRRRFRQSNLSRRH